LGASNNPTRRFYAFDCSCDLGSVVLERAQPLVVVAFHGRTVAGWCAVFVGRLLPSPVFDLADNQGAHELKMLLLIILLILLFGGGLGYVGHANWGPYGGGIGIGTVLLIVLIIYLLGGFR
jgi:hypothetical protein